MTSEIENNQMEPANSSSFNLSLIDGVLLGLAFYIILAILPQWFPGLPRYSSLFAGDFSVVLFEVFSLVTIFKLYGSLRDVHQDLLLAKRSILQLNKDLAAIMDRKTQRNFSKENEG
ncbi:MAG: hypothetical protein ACFFE8_10720 [Candidatus Heimdallarchaeota archaeon]